MIYPHKAEYMCPVTKSVNTAVSATAAEAAKC